MQTYSVLTDEYAFTAAKTDAFITPSVFNSADKTPTEAENEDRNKAVKESEPLSIRALLARRMRLCGLPGKPAVVTVDILSPKKRKVY